MPVPEWIVAVGGPGPALLLLGGLAGGCVLFGRGFVLWRRKRLIEDTPTARIRSMPLGRVEVFGRAEEKTALEAPLTGTRCVYYRYRSPSPSSRGADRPKERASHAS